MMDINLRMIIENWVDKINEIDETSIYKPLFHRNLALRIIPKKSSLNKRQGYMKFKTGKQMLKTIIGLYASCKLYPKMPILTHPERIYEVAELTKKLLKKEKAYLKKL